jgi:predicted  nucleic acid-binding Zn-ribbon protein
LEEELEKSSSHSISPIDLSNLEDDDDEESVAESSFHKSVSHIQAENLVSEMCQALQYQRSQVKALDNAIKNHKERAAILQMMGTEQEITEVTDKIEVIKAEREKVQAAISLLSLHIINMESELEDAEQSLMAASQSHHGSFFREGGSQVNIDFSEHETYAQEVEEVLSSSLKNLRF